MNNFYRRYGLPFLIMILGGFVVSLMHQFLKGSFVSSIVTVTIALFLFAFGLSLNIHKKRRDESWFKKLVCFFIFLSFLMWDLGYFVFPSLMFALNFLGIEGFVIQMVYIYCGWTFFD